MFWWSQDISYDPPERHAGSSQQPSRDSTMGKPSGPQSPRLPRGFSGKEAACLHRRCGFGSWVRKTPLWRKWQPTPAPLPGKSHGQRNLADSGPRGHKESDMTEQVHIHALIFSRPFTSWYRLSFTCPRGNQKTEEVTNAHTRQSPRHGEERRSEKDGRWI